MYYIAAQNSAAQSLPVLQYDILLEFGKLEKFLLHNYFLSFVITHDSKYLNIYKK